MKEKTFYIKKMDKTANQEIHKVRIKIPNKDKKKPPKTGMRETVYMGDRK